MSDDPRHFLKKASEANDAFCFGRYTGVHIEKVLLNVSVSGRYYSEAKAGKFTLVRVLFSNLWDHRISINTWLESKLIDSEEIQHKPEIDLHVLKSETQVQVSKKHSVGYEFSCPDRIIEGKAKTRGWLWFPALPGGIYPQRLIFNFSIFAPGYTSGAVEDHETIEVAFDFPLRELLPAAKNEFGMLQIEDSSQEQQD